MNNSASTNGIWVSVHLFYAEPWESFLALGIKSFVDGLDKENRITGFFFIRYWERGPHIRLRVKVNSEADVADMNSRITDYFQAYFDAYPSSIESPGQGNYPNNSVQFIGYEPEVERYGGEEGVAIAEKYFEVSSRMVLRLIEKNRDEWDYDLALGLAIEMQLGFVMQFTSGIDEIKRFLTSFTEWTFCFGAMLQLRNKAGANSQEDDFFKALFDQQAATIVPYVQNVYQEIKVNSTETDQDIQEWNSLIFPILESLKFVCNKQIFTDNRFAANDDAGLGKTRWWMILYSYMHMTNNRLGIKNQDEGYLAYIIKKAI